MADDLAAKTDEINESITEALEELFEKEAEAVDSIDEMSWTNSTDNEW